MVNARPRALSAGYLESIPSLLHPIFEQAQHNTANHRKNHVSLRKIQEQCSTITETTSRGIKLVGEKAFNTAFIGMVNHILGVKKGVTIADRVVKFIASYVAYTTELDLATRTEEEEDIDTPYTRFVVKLLRHLLAGMDSKDKNVRFRVTLLTVSMVNGLGEINEDLYILLRKRLLERAEDKEVAVRVQAALGLAKLQSGEDEDDLEDGQEPLSEVLLDFLNHDTSGEVRRAALYNLPRTAATLPHILTRTRDIDPLLRRTVYHGSLSATALPDARLLSIAQREQVARNGLGDRESSVRKATAAMLGGWVDQTEGDLVEFLNRFDVVSSEVAEEALLSVFVTRPELFESLEFPDVYWTSLTPEKAFLARVFVDHCIAKKDEARLEDTMPVVTALVMCTQDEYNKLANAMNDENVEEGDTAEQAFIVGELLRLSVNLDYADETGRRAMHDLTRKMISEPDLPESLIPKCMDVLCKCATSERDLIRIIVDVVSGLREGDGDEEEVDQPMSSDMSMVGSPSRRRTMAAGALIDDPEQAERKALVDLRSLLICNSMLERISSQLQDNSVFHGLLPDLIVPAVQNTEDAALRDQGLLCLGLCCMLDAKMASNSFGLFVQQVSAADDELQVKVVKILFDLLTLHDIETLVAGTLPVEKLVELVRHTLNQEAAAVQAVACEGAVKLMLHGRISDPTILQSLILLYFSPETADNQPLRQCLAYSLPVYCYMSFAHQRSLLSIFESTFDMLVQLHEEAEDEPMLPLAQMGLILVDWLDPQKTVIRHENEMDHTLHLDLGIEILKALLAETSKEVRKALVSFLSKLYLPEPEDVEPWQVQSLQQLVLSIPTKRPLADASSRNALGRFGTAIQKKYPEILDGFNEDLFRGDERQQVRELFGFIDDVEERDAETASEAGSRRPKSGRSGRGLSRDWSEAPTETTVTTMSALDDEEEPDQDEDEEEEEDEEDPDPTPRKSAPAPSRSKPNPKPVTKPKGATRKSRQSDRSRLAEEDMDVDEEDEDEDVESILGRPKVKVEVEEESDEEEEEEDDDDEEDSDSDSDDPLI